MKSLEELKYRTQKQVNVQRARSLSKEVLLSETDTEKVSFTFPDSTEHLMPIK